MEDEGRDRRHGTIDRQSAVGRSRSHGTIRDSRRSGRSVKVAPLRMLYNT